MRRSHHRPFYAADPLDNNRLAGTYLTTVPASIKDCLAHLSPIIEERMARMAEHGTGNYAEKPVRTPLPAPALPSPTPDT